MEEVWKDVEGFEGAYAVSSLGRVKSLTRVLPDGRVRKERMLRLCKGKAGYFQVGLSKLGKAKTRAVHSLVAAAFLASDSCRGLVNHKDSVKTHNPVANLEYATHGENSKHAMASRAFIPFAPPKLTEADVRAIRAEYRRGVVGYQKLAKKFNVVKNTIKFVIDRATWQNVA